MDKNLEENGSTGRLPAESCRLSGVGETQRHTRSLEITSAQKASGYESEQRYPASTATNSSAEAR